MDEKGKTFICDLIARCQPEPPMCTTMPMYLIMVSGGIPGAMLRLAPGGTRLGRATESTFQLSEISISRRHATIDADAQGVVRLTDLGSTNGTFLNGRRLRPHEPFRLKDGDRVQLGSSVIFKFVRLDPCEEQFQREMYERTVRDGLTGLYNRSFFLNQVGPLAQFGAGCGLGLAILMLDIDHFKRINDAHGHDAGDVVLREVADVLRESTRNEDLVARYGGEEFVLALPVSAPDQATERAERIRASLAERPIVAGSTLLRVTASLGLAFAPADRPRSPAALITAADRCLLQAKHAGRDRIVFRPDLAYSLHEPGTTAGD
jgi:two-component system cell cycle response regulator